MENTLEYRVIPWSDMATNDIYISNPREILAKRPIQVHSYTMPNPLPLSNALARAGSTKSTIAAVWISPEGKIRITEPTTLSVYDRFEGFFAQGEIENNPYKVAMIEGTNIITCKIEADERCRNAIEQQLRQTYTCSSEFREKIATRLETLASYVRSR